MLQKPKVGLILCDQVVFEQGTQKPYLLGVLSGKSFESFPTGPQQFDVFAPLRDGLGSGKMTLRVVRLAAVNEEIFSQTWAVDFPDPLCVINLRFRFRYLKFNAPGIYLFALVVENEEIATRRLRVFQVGGSP